MKVLFVMFRPKYVNTYEPALRLLAERGHRLHFAFSVGKSATGRKRFDAGPLELLRGDFPDAVTWDEDAPARDPADGWFGIAFGVRVFGDLWRYVHPRYADAVLLRQRVARRARRFALDDLPLLIGRPLWRLSQRWSKHPDADRSDRLLGLAHDLERAIPPSGAITSYIRAVAPDVVLVTPLVDVASDQAEFVKSAESLGIPSAVCVNSWDNLTNKGVIRVDPDAVIVWNEAQRIEAVELHGVEHERVVVTGAQKFDEWFRRRPTLAAGDFKAKVGLDPNEPYVLYVCSSRFIAAHETQFVERWLQAVREELGPVGVLIRPHPENGAMWREVDLSRFGNVAVYPPEGAEVTGDEQRADFFDSLAHSEAVVGINTSAMIEAAIVGKGVYTVLDGEFRGTQEGTLHFHHLLHENGGILRVGRDLGEHVQQLRDGLASQATESRAFVESFVRPLGLDVAAAPVVADAIERIAASPARGPVVTHRSRALAAVLGAAARTQRRGAGRPDAVLGLVDRVVGKQLELEFGPLRRLSGSIVIGPYLGDTLEETLYWIPYVRRLVARLGLPRERLIAVSHGGVGAWYEDVCGTYVELGDVVEPDVRSRALTGWLAERDEARREILARLGVESAASIPATSARRVFHAYRTGRAPLEIVWEFAEHRALPAVEAVTAVAVEESLLADVVVAALAPRASIVEPGLERGRQSDLVRESSLLVARPDGLAALGVLAGATTIAVRGDGELAEPDVELLAHVAQRLGGAFTLLDRSELPFLRELV